MKLSGKTALITGGATGIGEATARALAGEGCRVAIAGRREDKLRATAERWKGDAKILVHPVDVTDRKSVAELVKWADAELGKIDILVNNAGINSKQRMMGDMPPELWDEVLAINVTGAYNCMREILPQMRARRDGLIVNMCSISSKRAGVLGGVAYNASKFAELALGTTVSLEEGKNGIRVTSVCPGEVDTPLLDERPSAVSAEHRARILMPEDIAAAVLMIACLPPRAHVAEIIIKPTWQDYF